MLIASAQALGTVTPNAARAGARTLLQALALPRLHPSWNGDFASGTWSAYNESPRFHPDGNPADFAIVRHPAPPGFRHSFKATVQSGTGSIIPGEPGERTMLTVWPGDTDAGVHDPTRAYQGANSWYRDEIYFPSNFHPTRDTAFNWVYHLHEYPDPYGVANLALSVVTDTSDHGGPDNRGRLSTRIVGGGSPADPIDATRHGQILYGSDTYRRNRAVRQRWIVGPRFKRRRWDDFVWHVHWDWRSNRHGGHGFVQYFINGRRIGSYHGPTLFYYANNGTGHGGPGQAYLKDGFYRPTNRDAGYAQPTVSVYDAATMIGPTAASIGERLR